ncbi:MAG TPA: hypothetical protein PK224_09285 [Nitrospira sp.]|nr:hypothetical protein [Nitrospira sp.]
MSERQNNSSERAIAQFRQQLSAHFSNALQFEAVDLTESDVLLSDFDIRLRAPWLSGLTKPARRGPVDLLVGRSSLENRTTRANHDGF